MDLKSITHRKKAQNNIDNFDMRNTNANEETVIINGGAPDENK